MPTSITSLLDRPEGPNVEAETLSDPRYLPSIREIEEIFGTTDTPEARRRWDQFCGDRQLPVLEVLTQEFVGALGDYLNKRCIALGASESDPLTILEIGARDGRLTHFLGQYNGSTGQVGMRLVATDGRKTNFQSPLPLERIELEGALAKYEPTIVVASWLPSGVDVTQAIRGCPLVDEYVLIGEPDEGCCGDHWLPWGKSDSRKPERWQYDNDDGTFDQGAYNDALDVYSRMYKTPPYVKDGFIRTDLDFISRTQKCMFDYPGVQGPSLSSTVSFRRQS